MEIESRDRLRLLTRLEERLSNPSVNSHLSILITICRSGSFPRRIKQLR
jgi:hypothetical protein